MLDMICRKLKDSLTSTFSAFRFPCGDKSSVQGFQFLRVEVLPLSKRIFEGFELVWYRLIGDRLPKQVQPVSMGFLNSHIPHPQFSWSGEHKGQGAGKGGKVLDVLDDDDLHLDHLHRHHHHLLSGLHSQRLHHQQLYRLNFQLSIFWSELRVVILLFCSQASFFVWFIINHLTDMNAKLPCFVYQWRETDIAHFWKDWRMLPRLTYLSKVYGCGPTE